VDSALVGAAFSHPSQLGKGILADADAGRCNADADIKNEELKILYIRNAIG
jgi:hypothetical protein